jgi:hypothetical protein
MWWASAGERRIASEDETDHDSILLDGFGITTDPQTPLSARRRSQSSLPQMLRPQGEQSAKREMAIIAYFHRLTTRILTTLSDIIDATSSDDEEDDGEEALLQDSVDGSEDGDEGPSIFITSTDITKMGLDEWSSSDQAFIEEVAKAFFGRKVKVQSACIDVCGIRIC